MDAKAAGRYDGPMMNTYWVVPGRFAAGEYPGALSRREAADRLGVLLRAGLDQFIDLTQAHELLEPYDGLAAQQAEGLGVDFVHERHAIVDMDVPSSPQHMVGILDSIDRALAAGRSVYVHCWGGIGRTGTVVGCWFVRHGFTGDQALEEIAKRWLWMEKAIRFPRSPQTPQQRDYIRHWTEPRRTPA